jgi:hypothetical protein
VALLAEFDVGKQRKPGRPRKKKTANDTPRSTISVPSSEFAKMVTDLARDAGLSVEDYLVHIGFVTAILDLHATMSERRAVESRARFRKLTEAGQKPMDLSKN